MQCYGKFAGWDSLERVRLERASCHSGTLVGWDAVEGASCHYDKSAGWNSLKEASLAHHEYISRKGGMHRSCHYGKPAGAH